MGGLDCDAIIKTVDMVIQNDEAYKIIQAI